MLPLVPFGRMRQHALVSERKRRLLDLGDVFRQTLCHYSIKSIQNNEKRTNSRDIERDGRHMVELKSKERLREKEVKSQ